MQPLVKGCHCNQLHAGMIRCIPLLGTKMVSPEAMETLFSSASAHSMCQVRQRMPQTAGRPEEAEWDFAAQANAMVVKNAESYYRNMFFQSQCTCIAASCHRPAASCALLPWPVAYGDPSRKVPLCTPASRPKQIYSLAIIPDQ